MRNAYLKTQAVTLSHERAFEELYLRLARWTADVSDAGIDRDTASAQLDRCVSLLGYMSSLIDLSQNYEIAAAILTLNRFAIGAIVRAKSEREEGPLKGLPRVFMSLAEIFAAISGRGVARDSTNTV